MKLNIFILTMYILFNNLAICCLDLSITNLYQLSNFEEVDNNNKLDITNDLLKKIKELDNRSVLSVNLINSEEIPKSIFEIKTICSNENIDLILYGFLEISDYSYNLEIKLYDHNAGKILKIFYSKNSIDNYDQLVETMGFRVLTYIYDILGINISSYDKNRGFLSFDTGLGYWIPFEPYSKSIMGLGSVHTAFNFFPVEPLFKMGIFGISPGFGISLDYLIGKNRSGFENFIIHSPKLGLPLYFSFLWNDRNKIIYNISPGINLDIVQQERLYEESKTEIASAFVLSSGLSYEYLVRNNKYSIGLLVNSSLVFYNELLFSINPSIIFKFY